MLQAQIYINKNDLIGLQPLHEFIFKFLIKQNIMGATAFRGQLGFGINHYLHNPDVLFSFDEPPMVITFIDEGIKVQKALTELRTVMKKGFIVTCHVEKWD